MNKKDFLQSESLSVCSNCGVNGLCCAICDESILSGEKLNCCAEVHGIHLCLRCHEELN